MVIKVCMGSSCHMKGAYKIVEKLKKFPNIKLYGALCMGNCSNGVNVEINGKLYSNITEENIEELIMKIMETEKSENNG
ncbi:NADH:ubiquinone oxidoreductase 24 kD subunit-like protein [Pseudothermotoga thermarum DSM 5069]|uniref:NADH:ubiquinone oxidoreductase 24 kD subunit-like protein n=2 Tax=Pseudothermotoga thermarum TaxID=119394 RepID=F7YUM3_9THEM|nr:NADH:ubiquinone oxidoreductase 24 kD subunit-like protein [Pseudothermotoga thermarum DSM 5069]